MGLEIEGQVGKERGKALASKTTLVCPRTVKSCLGVKFREVHATNTEMPLNRQKNTAIPHKEWTDLLGHAEQHWNSLTWL